MQRLRRSIVVGLVIALLAPAAAFAGNISATQGTAGSSQGAINGGGTLPFTGLNLAVIGPFEDTARFEELLAVPA